MTRKSSMEVDNRDAGEMYEYLEARIDALKRRVAELEADNEMLRHCNLSGVHPSRMSKYAGRAEQVAAAFA